MYRYYALIAPGALMVSPHWAQLRGRWAHIDGRANMAAQIVAAPQTYSTRGRNRGYGTNTVTRGAYCGALYTNSAVRSQNF